jgi:hypothetical protein
VPDLLVQLKDPETVAERPPRSSGIHDSGADAGRVRGADGGRPETLDRVGAVSPAPALRTSRRTTLGGALAGVALLAGCDLGSDDPGSGPAPTADPDDPDTSLVAEVVDDLVATLAVVEAARHQHGSLRRQLGELAKVHRAHLEVLGSNERPGRAGPRTADADGALALVRRREQRHERRLTDRAVQAQSGRLARLLASMSAAVAQQLAVPPLGKVDR